MTSKFFLYPSKYSPILPFTELNEIAFIVKPDLDLRTNEICFFLRIIIFTAFNL